jgi:hypothetical protein
MSAINAANSPDNQAIASFLRSNSTASAATPPTDSTKPDTASDTASGGDEAATVVDLSDHAKTILTKAQNDQVAADSLQAFIDAHHAGKNGGPSSKAGASADDASKGSGSKIVATYQQLTVGIAPSVDPQALAPVDPKVNFYNSLQVGGFSISVSANAGTGAFSAAINGPGGIQWTDQRFGRNGEVSGGTVPKGMGMMSAQTAGNMEYITFYETDFSAESVTASAEAGTLSSSSISAHSASMTFAIDFTTGAIHSVQSEQSAYAATTQFNPSASQFSRVA